MRDDSTPLGWTIGIPRLPGASCTTTDPELFFPDQVNTHGHTVPGAKGRERDAIAICDTCPACAACLAYALAHGEKYGVWGGTTEADRKLVRPKRKSPPPRTHCMNGHAFTDENTRITPRRRVCRTCEREPLRQAQKAAWQRLARAATKARKQVAV